jgi:LytR cell envelope-related transcriptional attenuator
MRRTYIKAGNMAKNFPPDEFDSVTGVGGRHRAKRTAASRFVSFSRYAAVTLVLAGAGIVALNVASGSTAFTDAVSGTTGQAGFNANGMAVTVIDATSKTGLAGKVAKNLYDAGWNVITATNYTLLPKLSAIVASPAPTATPIAAASPTPGASATPAVGDKTVVYVNSASAQSAAQDLLHTLGNYSVVETNTYADPITIVLGNDYK